MFPFDMKTGFSPLKEQSNTINLEKIENLLLLFSQKSIVLGAHYATCAGRNNLSGEDIIYSLQYFAHEFMKIDSLENDLENFDSDSDSDSEFDSDFDSDDLFTRADDSDEFCKKINYYHDTWNEWNPTDEIECVLKRNIDKIINK